MRESDERRISEIGDELDSVIERLRSHTYSDDSLKDLLERASEIEACGRCLWAAVYDAIEHRKIDII